MIVRHGRLIFEAYGSGAFRPWRGELADFPYDATTPHDVRSVSKSVVSLLVGIAIDRKLIGGVEDRIFDYMPEYAELRTPEKDHIRIRHLLEMTSGLSWH